MSHVDFSSWPREQEQSFVPFEQHNAQSQQKAWMIGGIAGAIVFFFFVGIYFGVSPDKHDISKDMNMSNLSKKGDATKTETPAEKK